MAKKYNLTDSQVKDLAIICYREQGGNSDGVKACASQMCNYYEKYQTKNFASVYDCVMKSGWYGSETMNREWIAEHPNVDDYVVQCVREVIVYARRTLPEYVCEYDCMSDIDRIINNGVTYTKSRNKSYVTNRYNYVKDKTIIQNRYAESSYDRYTFYCFPDGPEGTCDAFGYISKPSNASDDSAEADSSFEEPTNASYDPVEKAISWMEEIACDDSHGYDQQYRWNQRGDYDCSSLVISAYEQAGIPVKTNGATYTGDMYDVFISCGFKDVTSQVDASAGTGLKRGDVLLNHQRHTALYCGNGNQVDACGNEYGGATGGQPGDQTGKEIMIRPFQHGYPWDCVLRYEGTASGTQSTGGRKTIMYGVKGADVLYLQKLLNKLSYTGYNGKPLIEDGEFGVNTLTAVRAFQKDYGLEVDGIVGKMTWSELIKRAAK